MNKHIILIDGANGGKMALFIEDIVYIGTEKGHTEINTLPGNGEGIHYLTTESVESLVARINKILSGHD